MSTARKPSTLSRLAVTAGVLAAAAALAAPLAPASATTTLRGCAVDPVRPVAAGRIAGVQQARHNVVISCLGGRTVQVQQFMFEEDAPPVPDAVFDSRITNHQFLPGAGGLRTQRTLVAVPQTEPGDEEIYQRVRFRVSVGGGAFSPWTAFEDTTTLSIGN